MDAIIMQGTRPGPTSIFWDVFGSCLIIQVDTQSPIKPKLPKPKGWNLAVDYSLQHHRIGGVTNGEFSVSVLYRSQDEPNVFLPRTVSRTLGDCLSSTIEGVRVSPPEKGQTNTYKGVLDFSRQFQSIIANTVFD